MDNKNAVALISAAIGIAPAQALAQVQWTRHGATPSQITLPRCQGPSGQIVDSRSRADIIANRGGLVGNIEEITERMVHARWQRTGRGEHERYSITIPYSIACTNVALRFWVVEVNDNLMRTGTQRLSGDCDLTTNAEGVKYLTPQKRDQLVRLRDEFYEARNSEMRQVRSWHRMAHPWQDGEKQLWRRRTDDRFTRTLHYTFCGRSGYEATFYADWRGSLGAMKPKSKSY